MLWDLIWRYGAYRMADIANSELFGQLRKVPIALVDGDVRECRLEGCHHV